MGGTGDWGLGIGAPRRGAGAWRVFIAWVLFPLSSFLFPSARAQGVVELLQQQRLEARLAEVSAALGDVSPLRPLVRLGEADPFTARFDAVAARRQAVRDSLVADSLAQVRRDSLAGTPDRLLWTKVEPDAQGVFLERFREAFWKAADSRQTVVDTTGTPLLRALLQSAFGRPTRNADAVRQVGYTGNEFVQFEYWFVVNDSIPVLLLDLDGPFGRGLLVAGSEEFASELSALKANLAIRLLGAPGPDPFVDYYHSFERQQWFRTGYNGTDYFTVPIRPPGWSQRDTVDRWIIHR